METIHHPVVNVDAPSDVEVPQFDFP